MENQEKEIIKEPSFPVKPWKIFFWEASLFFLTFILGIFTARRLIGIIKLEELSVEPLSSYNFLISFLVASLIVFLIVRFLKSKPVKEILFKFLFIISVFLGGSIFLEIWFGTSIALISILILIFLWIKSPDILIHDILFILATVGLVNVLGSRIEPQSAILFLVIFSIYDIIAVYKTKHMVKMAKDMIGLRVIPGIILPSKASEFKTQLKTVEFGGKFLVLGGGDIFFPLLLSISLLSKGIFDSFLIAIFALIGLFISFYIFISQKERRAIPALPPIALLSIIGYLITEIF